MIVPIEKYSVIYCIWNNITDDYYIGSAQNYRHRILTHLRALKANKHHSKHLQNSWNKYGDNIFEVFILKKSNIDDLIADEQWCLDILRPKYNSCKIAGNTKGLKWTSERKIKQLKYLSNKPKSHIDSFKRAIRESDIFIKTSIAKCKVMVENNKVAIEMLDEDNNIVNIYSSIKECAKSLETYPNTIQYYLQGKAKSLYKGKYKFKYK